MEDTIFNNGCTETIGCRYHRAWDKNFVRYIGYDYAGIEEINFNNSHDDRQKHQYLCYLANHRVINRILIENKLMLKRIEELNEKDYTDNFKDTSKLCFGLNFGMGSKKICIRLKYNNIFLTHDAMMTILIHELTHMTATEHDDYFNSVQNQLRTQYNSYTMDKIAWVDFNEDSNRSLYNIFKWIYHKCKNMITSIMKR